MRARTPRLNGVSKKSPGPGALFPLAKPVSRLRLFKRARKSNSPLEARLLVFPASTFFFAIAALLPLCHAKSSAIG
jgi:hypothetical protein